MTSKAAIYATFTKIDAGKLRRYASATTFIGICYVKATRLAISSRPHKKSSTLWHER
jgi:hypothetical protein